MPCPMLVLVTSTLTAARTGYRIMAIMAIMFTLGIYLSLMGWAAAQSTQPSPTPGAPAPDFVPLCDPANFSTSPPLSDLPVPDLPDQFSFTLEQNEKEFNATAVLTLYYDGPGNHGRLETRVSDYLSVQIFDYTLGEIFAISGDICSVSAIADDPYSIFGIENRNGTRHIGSPRTFLEGLGEGVSTRYVGEDMVRGIPAQHWQSCSTVDHAYSNLNDYYFAAKGWDYAGQGKNLDATEMVPVQFTQKARYAYLDDSYHLTYYIVDFRAGPDSVPNSLFRIPNGLACTGRFPGQPVPQIPQFFSTYVQLVSTESPPLTVQTYREYYDLPRKLFRMDVFIIDSGPVSIIHDLSTSVQYIINNRATNCTVQSLEEYVPYLFDITINDEGTLQLVSPNNFFFLGNEFNYSYEGVSNIRGVDVDSWVSVRDFERATGIANYTDFIYEVFFTRPDWIYTTDRSINTDPVPWRIKLSGMAHYSYDTGASNISYEMDFFDFSTDEPPYDAFDISSCSAPEDFYTMILIIPGQERGIDFVQLRRNIRTSVTNYTGLRPLQIGNIQIVSENGTHIFVTFQISNLTSLVKIDPATNITAQQAVDLITGNTVGSQLPFQIQISPNVSVTPSLYNNMAGQGPNVSQCGNNTNVQPQPCNCTNNTPNMTLCPNTTDYNPTSCNCSSSLANTTDQSSNVTESCSQCNCSNDILPTPNNTGIMCPESNCSTTAGECTFNVTRCKNYCSQNNLTSTGASFNNVTNITTRLGLSNGAVAGIAIALFVLGIIAGVLLQLALGAAVHWCRNNCTSVNFKQPIKYKKQEESVSLT